MRAVNLLAYDARPDSAALRLRLPKTILPLAAGSLGAAALAGLALTFVQTSTIVSSREAELKDIRAELAALAPTSEAGKTAQELAQRRARQAALAGALSYRVAWDRLLDDLASVMPKDVWVTSLAVRAPSSPVTPAAAGAAAANGGTAPAAAADESESPFKVSGYAPSQASVASVLERLELLPQLSEVELETSLLAVVFDKKLIQFTVVANVRSKGSQP